WESLLHFNSIGAIKAGYLRKRKGIWTLTEEGTKALKLGQEGLLELVSKKYREWSQENHSRQVLSDEIEVENEEDIINIPTLNIEKYSNEAQQGIVDYINKKDGYDFQDLVAALLRSMGYYISFIAQKKGKDGGADIIAYKDPLGVETPHVKVQVKHKQNTSSPVDVVRKLIGVLKKDGDIGMVVSSGGFTPDAKSK